MKRVVFVTGIALFLSAGWLIRARHSAATRGAAVRSESQKKPSSIISEEEFRQKIRTIVQKVAADVKKEQASIAASPNRTAL